MNQKKLLGIGSLVLALLSFVDTAFACKCARTPTPCEAYGQAHAVFIGTAKELSWIEFEEKLEGVVAKRKQPVISFSVDQAFLGVNGSPISVMTGGDDCGYEFKIGEQYLVYASRRQKKEMLSTSACARTRPVRNAGVDLEYIRWVSKPSPGGWVFGSVFKANQASQRSLPLEGFEVTVEGQGKSVTVTTDSDGEFHASSLPDGNYKVRVAPTNGLSARINELEVRVADHRCATAPFWLEPDGRISGRVLDAEGRPLSNCVLLLYSVERSGFKDGAKLILAPRKDN